MIVHTDVSTEPVSSQWRARCGALLFGAGINLLLAMASGLLTSFLFPPFEVWWFAWIGPLPMLIALRRTAAVRAAGWLVLLYGITFSASALHWMQTIFGGSAIGIFVLMSLPWVLFGLAYRIMAGMTARWRSRLWAAAVMVLLAPVFWVAADWIRCEGWYFRFSWMQLGFAFSSCRHGGVLYPYIGVYGVTFLILLVNALLAEIVVVPISLSKKALGIVLCTAVVLPLTLYLNYPIGIPNTAGEQARPARVEVVQSEAGDLEELKSLTTPLLRYKPDLIVWPEYAVADYPFDNARLMQSLQAFARSTHSTLILGCKKHAANTARVDWLRRRAMMTMEGMLFGNIALVIGPDGRVLGEYHKTHPIQFFSDGVPGTSYPTFPTAVGRIGIGICYDFDFASCPLRLVRNGAELLVIPTFDSNEWTAVQHDQHSRMAQARAAEMGRWTVRATSSGVSQIINPSGFVTAVIWNGGPAATVGIAVPRREITWYVRWGYLLPDFCLGISGIWLLAILVMGCWGHLRRKSI